MQKTIFHSFVAVFVAAFGGPMLCMGAFVVLFTALVALSIPQLPNWAQDDVEAWMLGTPQPVGSETSDNGSSTAGIGVGWDGYTDHPLLPSGIPLFREPGGDWWVGCLFHDSNYTSHTGLDFPAWGGLPVYATMAGKVVWAGDNGPWGGLVVVENNGYQSWFAHFSAISVVEGQIVSYGDPVGNIGTTGNSTGNHLHYGIKEKKGEGQVWHDPLMFFDGAGYVKIPCPTK
ncbi:MAG: M23 family metallopeptidase [Chloroflexota bacterium]